MVAKPPAKRKAAKGGDAGEPFVPDVLPPPVKKSKGHPLVCRRCGEKPSDVEWACVDDNSEAIGEACKRCWRPFQAEYQRDGSWEHVADMCAADETCGAGFDKAANIMAHESPLGHDPCEVCATSKEELWTMRSYVGIPRNLFSETAGSNPNDRGFTKLDCNDELGGAFKGVVIVNPAKPLVE